MLTYDELIGDLRYHHTNGLFTWRVDVSRVARVGIIAGYVDKEHGYVKIRVRRQQYAAHRLAWFYMTREYPVLHIDHINGVRHDNAWRNLRLATPAENAQNMQMGRAKSLTGVLGIFVVNGNFEGPQPWGVNLTVGGAKKYLGGFRTLREAIVARLEGEQRYFRNAPVRCADELLIAAMGRLASNAEWEKITKILA